MRSLPCATQPIPDVRLPKHLSGFEITRFEETPSDSNDDQPLAHSRKPESQQEDQWQKYPVINNLWNQIVQ